MAVIVFKNIALNRKNKGHNSKGYYSVVLYILLRHGKGQSEDTKN